MRMIRRIGLILNATFVVVGISTALFVAANWIAYRYFLRPFVPIADVFAYVKQPSSDFGNSVYKEIFRVSSDDEAQERFRLSPSFAFHPTLPFATQTIKNKHFQIGIEGIRYEPGWTEKDVSGFLSGDLAPVIALGGSTMLGHGVSADETIPYFLNKLLAGSKVGRVLNFGSQAYDQRSEIDKLIYLLDRGYRPSHVIFFDGWNDVFISRSNMRVEDKIIYHGFALNRGEIAYTPGALISHSNALDLLLNSLPIYRAINERIKPVPSLAHITLGRNAFIDGFDFREAEFSFLHWAELGEHNRAYFINELLKYYQANLTLLKALAAEYKFSLHVFYQPIGLLDLKNPFVTPTARSASGYRYISELVDAARNAIGVGQMTMVDLSLALNETPGHRYIDVAHYSPEANKVIAKHIFDRVFR